MYMTVRECARTLAVSEKSIYRWCDLGLLPSIKIGRSIRIKREDVASIKVRGLVIKKADSNHCQPEKSVCSKSELLQLAKKAST